MQVYDSSSILSQWGDTGCWPFIALVTAVTSLPVIILHGGVRGAVASEPRDGKHTVYTCAWVNDSLTTLSLSHNSSSSSLLPSSSTPLLKINRHIHSSTLSWLWIQIHTLTLMTSYVQAVGNKWSAQNLTGLPLIPNLEINPQETITKTTPLIYTYFLFCC